MRRLFVLFLFINCTAYGQVTGSIIDGNGEAIPYANVVILVALDSSIIAGAFTDEQGLYSVKPTSTGVFIVKVSGLGYKTATSSLFTITDLAKPLELSPILLIDESNSLGEITISAKRDLIQNTPLGKIIRIQSSILTKGSNVLQVLERLPGVITDRRNNKFSLNGQSGVTVMFNGRKVQMPMEELMALLENTVANNIEKIELITSPTAQYDADGGAGIINIVFKNNDVRGTKVNLSSTLGYGYREKNVNSVSLSKGYKNASIFSSYSFSHDVGRSGFEGYGTNDGIGSFKSQSVVFSGYNRHFQNNHNFNLSTEFRPNDKISFGSDVIFSSTNTRNVSNNDVVWAFTDGDYLDFRALSQGKNIRQNFASALFMKYQCTKKSQLSIDVNYVLYTNDNPSMINADYYDAQGQLTNPSNPLYTNGNISESLSKIQASVLRTDYSMQVNAKLNVDLGLKGSVANNENRSKVERKENGLWVIDPRSQSLIDGQEKIGAIYSQLKWAISSKSNFHAGLRYEYWQRDINGNNVTFKVAKLFPSLMLTHRLNETLNFSLNYNRRISRPAYNDLISNLFYNDPTFVFAGNPLLKPTITDVLKADLSTNNWNAGLSFQYDLNPILRYQITTNETKDIGISSPQNLDFQKSINLFLGLPFEIKKNWKLTINSTTSLRKYKVSYTAKATDKIFAFQNLNINQSLQLPNGFELELSGWYNFPFYEGHNIIKGFGVLNLGIAKKLKNERGTFVLSLPDVLQSFRVNTHIGGAAPIVFNINTFSTWRDESALYRMVKLTYSRSFGNYTKSVKYNAKEEERERIN